MELFLQMKEWLIEGQKYMIFDLIAMVLLMLFPYWLFKIFCSIYKRESYRYISKRKVKKKIEEEYSNNNYLKISVKKIKRIAMRLIRKEKIFVSVLKIYLICVLLINIFVVPEREREIYQNLSLFTYIGYFLFVLYHEFKCKYKAKYNTTFVDYFVKYYLFEYFIGHGLISNFDNIPDRYKIVTLKDESEGNQ